MSGSDISQVLEKQFGLTGYVPKTEFDTADVTDAGFEDNILTHRSGDTLTIGYITHDGEPVDFWKDADGLGDLQIFRSEAERDAHIADVESEGKVCLVVDNYSHSDEHYSIQGSVDYPDRQWDVAPRGAFTPCDDVQQGYRDRVEAEGEDAARAWLIEGSNAVLDQYSKSVNGEVFGVVTETWEIDGNDARTNHDDSVWGFIGMDRAIEALREEMPEEDPENTPGM